MQEARVKPCDATNWKYSCWRPVKEILTTVEDLGQLSPNQPGTIRAISGGGVPIGARIVVYLGKPAGGTYCGSWYDFAENVEVRRLLL